MTGRGHPEGGPGRPEAALRPRDALGRPLPLGAVGVPPLPRFAPDSPHAVLRTAQNLLDEGRYFQAHEVLEAAWKAAPTTERGLWRGLTQIVVGLVHTARGNPRGAIALLRRGLGEITPYLPPASTAPPRPSVAQPPPSGPGPDSRAARAARAAGRVLPARRPRRGPELDLPGVADWAGELLDRLEAGHGLGPDLGPPRLLGGPARRPAGDDRLARSRGTARRINVPELPPLPRGRRRTR